MTPYEQIEPEAKEIYEFLSVPIADDIIEATEKGNMLAVYINRTGHLLSEAKYYLNERLNNEAVQIIKQITSGKYSAKLQNALIDSVCKRERYLVDEIEQLNKTAKYQIEWCRTVISKIKEEMKYNNFQT
jgi:hypothetical protein